MKYNRVTTCGIMYTIGANMPYGNGLLLEVADQYYIVTLTWYMINFADSVFPAPLSPLITHT